MQMSTAWAETTGRGCSGLPKAGRTRPLPPLLWDVGRWFWEGDKDLYLEPARQVNSVFSACQHCPAPVCSELSPRMLAESPDPCPQEWALLGRGLHLPSLSKQSRSF